jgi:fido (protein-threonine AMPylation protein)
MGRATRSEGNSRTQRSFFEQLVVDAGYALAWQRLDAGRIVPRMTRILRQIQGSALYEARHAETRNATPHRRSII